MGWYGRWPATITTRARRLPATTAACLERPRGRASPDEQNYRRIPAKRPRSKPSTEQRYGRGRRTPKNP